MFWKTMRPELEARGKHERQDAKEGRGREKTEDEHENHESVDDRIV